MDAVHNLVRERWFRRKAEEAERRARANRSTLEGFKGSTSTLIARCLRELAEAHEEAAAVYRRRIEELR